VRVSAKSDYALRALIEIALRTSGPDGAAPVSAEALGNAQDIPHGFLQAILGDLRKADVLVSVRGKLGGWRFARAPEEISVADVIRAVDGPLVSVYGVRPESVGYGESAEVLQHVWIAARASLRDVFERVSIRDLADRQLPPEVAALTDDEDAWRPH
jgi:Rrf2 family protein